MKIKKKDQAGRCSSFDIDHFDNGFLQRMHISYRLPSYLS